MGWLIYVVAGILFLASVGYGIVQWKKFRDVSKDYLAQHPDAARVYLAYQGLAAGGAVSVYTVNGELPARFVGGAKNGFYLPPGTNIAVVSHEHTRRGVLGKTLAEGTGRTEMVLEAQPRQNYLLEFDSAAGEFTFLPLNRTGKT